MLLVHGAWFWEDNLLPSFTERGHPTRAVDLRGHGRSRAPGTVLNCPCPPPAPFLNHAARLVVATPRPGAQGAARPGSPGAGPDSGRAENHMRTILKTVGAIVLAGAALAAGHAAFALDDTARQPVVVTPIASTNLTAAGQPIMLPQKDARVIASLFEIAPGATLPVHKHPYQRYGYMLEGELLVTNVETGAKTTYRAGDFIVEMLDIWHQGVAVGPGAGRLVVIDQVEGDVQNTLLRSKTTP